MAPPEAEWLLWAERCKIEFKKISTLGASLAQAKSMIESLTEKLTDLMASHENLHAENNNLKDRILYLEGETNQQDQINTLTEKVADLAASNENLHAEISTSRDRGVHLEQEANQQDQINAVNEQRRDELEVRMGKLDLEFGGVCRAVEHILTALGRHREEQTRQLGRMKAFCES